jgi:hypothetical protein
MIEDDFEAQCDAIREQNARLLQQFEQSLKAAGLGDRTVRTHRENIDFFINEYLLYDGAVTPDEGWAAIGWFLGDWFIRKAMWASETSIKGNATSLKKFYAFMLQQERVDAAALEQLKQEIRDGMPVWLERLRRYHDPEQFESSWW